MWGVTPSSPAWAASPVYLLARWFVGLTPDPDAPGGYAVAERGFFRNLDCTLALGEKTVRIRTRDGKTRVEEVPAGS